MIQQPLFPTAGAGRGGSRRGAAEAEGCVRGPADRQPARSLALRALQQPIVARQAAWEA